MEINPKQLLAPQEYANSWVEGMNDETYHADKTSVSNSTLKVAELVSLKSFYHSFFVAERKEPSQDMKFGKLAHMAILEGTQFKERYRVMPEFVGPTLDGKMSAQSKAAKEKRAAWIADQPPGTIITTMAERDQILGMIDSLLSHAKANDFLRTGIAEVSGFYRDPVTGIRCRIRPDFMCRKRRIITELKTTMDCSEKAFQWQIFGDRSGLWYAMQLAMQMEGFKIIEGKPIEAAAWVAIEREAPYEVAVHPMWPAVQDLGHIRYRRALTKVKEGIDSGVWSGRQNPDDVSFINPPLAMLDEYGINHEGELI